VYNPPNRRDRDAVPYLVRARRISRLPNGPHGEMLAVCEALNVALEHARNGDLVDTVVMVFNDNMDVQDFLVCGTTAQMASLPGNPQLDQDLKPVAEAIIWLTHRLRDFGCDVELHWIPGHHHGVLPHRIVDVVSRDMRRGTEEGVWDFGRHWRYDGSRWRDMIVLRLDSVLANREPLP
jgi:hypothetical protein